MKKKILITGGKGTVGSYISKVFNKDKYNLLITGKEELDVTNKKQVFSKISKFNPDVVIHLAAKTNVDECERSPKDCFLVSSKGTKNIAEGCKKTGSLLIYTSTSAVFNGKKKGYFEDDNPDPINVYAKAKLEGEKHIKKILNRYFIVRAGWIIGGGKLEKKFISIIIDLSKKKKELKIAQDKFGTLVYAKDLVNFFEELVSEKHPHGIYHFGTKGICSRLDDQKPGKYC